VVFLVLLQVFVVTTIAPIRKAVFPIAGLGSRFLPATKTAPKEMLAVVDKPLIQYAVEEAYEAGIRQMIFVTGRTKRAVEDHFDLAYELENELSLAGKSHLLQTVRDITPSDMQCFHVRQPRALGLGHAILCAKDLVGPEAFAVLLADDLIVAKPCVMAQLNAQFQILGQSVLAVQEVPRSQVHQYGIVEAESPAGKTGKIVGIVEKPRQYEAKSNLAVAGRYVLTPAIFEILSQMHAAQTSSSELQLTDAIARLLVQEDVWAHSYEGERFDCGSKLGFLQANVRLARSHPEIGKEFSLWLQSTAQPALPL
jgi:UTP--glucose-1-phosphate uridylyltransferase